MRARLGNVSNQHAFQLDGTTYQGGELLPSVVQNAGHAAANDAHAQYTDADGGFAQFVPSNLIRF
jgi:hypothetical protein